MASTRFPRKKTCTLLFAKIHAAIVPGLNYATQIAPSFKMHSSTQPSGRREVGFKKRAESSEREDESEDFSHDFPPPPLLPPSCSLSIVITMMMIRLKLSPSPFLSPSLSPLFCDVASKVVMPRQWRNDPHRHRLLRGGPFFRRGIQNGPNFREERERERERVWVFGRRRTKGEIGSDEAVAAAAAARCCRRCERVFFAMEGGR